MLLLTGRALLCYTVSQPFINSTLLFYHKLQLLYLIQHPFMMLLLHGARRILTKWMRFDVHKAAFIG